MEMKNREQRRREKFGRAGKVHQHNPVGPWPDSEANPALKNVAGDQAEVTTEPVRDDTAEATAAPAAKAAKPAPARKATPTKKAPAPTKTAKG